MKANELMIGDWIDVNGIPAQVFELAYNKNEKEMTIGILDPQGEVYSCYYGYDHVEPIPITEDILDKNFKDMAEPHQRIYGGRWVYYDEYIEIEITEYTDGLWQVEVDEVEMSGLPSWKMYVSNVHELQHALRLCNFNKEIIL